MDLRASLASRWNAHSTRWLTTLRDWPWADTLQVLRLRFREDRLGLTAGSLTFTTLIALVPLVTVMLAVFAAFPMFASFEVALENYFLQTLIPDSIARPVLGALTEFAGNASRLGVAGLLLLLASALALMLTIDRALNSIWRVRQVRPLARRIAIYWAALTLGPLALGISLSATSYAMSASSGLVQALPERVAVVVDATEFGLLLLTIAALFRFVPNTHVRWSHALVGAMFCAVAFEVAKTLLAWYVAAVPSFSAVYGTFATLPILLLWLYLGWVIVLLGAVMTAYAPSLQMRIVLRPWAPGDSFALALAVLRALRRSRDAPPHGLGALEIARTLRADPLQVEAALQQAVDLGWVARLDEGEDSRHVLLADPLRTAAAPLIDALLLHPDRETGAFRQHAGLDRMVLADLL